MEKERILGKIAALISAFTVMTYASNSGVYITSGSNKLNTITTQYKHMSTTELEKEVERLTISGDVPFEMGLELMKRWTTQG